MKNQSKVRYKVRYRTFQLRRKLPSSRRLDRGSHGWGRAAPAHKQTRRRARASRQLLQQARMTWRTSRRCDREFLEPLSRCWTFSRTPMTFAVNTSTDLDHTKHVWAALTNRGAHVRDASNQGIWKWTQSRFAKTISIGWSHKFQNEPCSFQSQHQAHYDNLCAFSRVAWHMDNNIWNLVQKHWRLTENEQKTNRKQPENYQRTHEK